MRRTVCSGPHFIVGVPRVAWRQRITLRHSSDYKLKIFDDPHTQKKAPRRSASSARGRQHLPPALRLSVSHARHRPRGARRRPHLRTRLETEMRELRRPNCKNSHGIDSEGTKDQTTRRCEALFYATPITKWRKVRKSAPMVNRTEPTSHMLTMIP